MPRDKRRLGWLVVGASIVLGVVVLTSLFAASVYSMYPKRIHESVIQGLKLQSEQQLTATEDGARLAAAFDAMSALNEDGNLGWRDLFDVLLEFRREHRRVGDEILGQRVRVDELDRSPETLGERSCDESGAIRVSREVDGEHDPIDGF